MNIKLLLSLILSLSGCSYQVIDISNRYFSYKTKEFSSFKIVQLSHLPATSVCWPFEDVIKQVNELKEQSKDKLSVTNQMDRLLQAFKISDIFNSTPSTEEVLAISPACAVRLAQEFAWRKPWYNRTECQSMFSIDKYVHRLSLCYRFTPKKYMKEVDSTHNIFSPSRPGFIYMLSLNPKIFGNVSTFTAYGHSRHSSQLFDSFFSIEKTMWTNGRPFRIGIMSTPVSKYDLPAPYDTNCRIVPGYGSGLEYTLDRLNNQSMEKMKYSHTLGHVYKPFLYPILTPYEFRKEGITKKFNDLYDQARQFDFTVCHFEYNIPKTGLEEDEGITIAVNWSQEKQLTITKAPDQMIVDFIIYVCSSIGIWLGLSVFSAIEIVFDVLGKKKTTKVEDRKSARARNRYERNMDSRLRDISIITNGHSQALCDLIKVIHDQKNIIQNLASRIRRNDQEI